MQPLLSPSQRRTLSFAHPGCSRSCQPRRSPTSRAGIVSRYSGSRTGLPQLSVKTPAGCCWASSPAFIQGTLLLWRWLPIGFWNWATVTTFLQAILTKGKNVFSIRFRARVHNACKDSSSAKARRLLEKEARKVLTHGDAMSLTHPSSYAGKLEILSRIRGYGEDLDRSFLGKNLINTLNALAGTCSHLSAHRLVTKADVPKKLGWVVVEIWLAVDVRVGAWGKRQHLVPPSADAASHACSRHREGAALDARNSSDLRLLPSGRGGVHRIGKTCVL